MVFFMKRSSSLLNRVGKFMPKNFMRLTPGGCWAKIKTRISFKMTSGLLQTISELTFKKYINHNITFVSH